MIAAPIYAFTCETCGSFDLHRPAGEAGAELDCPGCGQRARRRWTTPGVRTTAAPVRAARDREERSGHEPRVVGAPSGRPIPGLHSHGGAPPWAVGH